MTLGKPLCLPGPLLFYAYCKQPGVGSGYEIIQQSQNDVVNAHNWLKTVHSPDCQILHKGSSCTGVLILTTDEESYLTEPGCEFIVFGNHVIQSVTKALMLMAIGTTEAASDDSGYTAHK